MNPVKRSTQLKKVILELLKEHHLLSATQLIEKLHQKDMNVNKTSVYRNLESFLEDNLICRQTFQDEFLYELQDQHHDHLYCNSCKKVSEIPCQIEVPTKIAGYSVEHHHLTLYGICPVCQKY